MFNAKGKAQMKRICDAERCSIMERFDELHGTINGKRATVSGRALDFPHVVALDGSGVKVEFAWATLRRAVDSGNVDLKS